MTNVNNYRLSKSVSGEDFVLILDHAALPSHRFFISQSKGKQRIVIAPSEVQPSDLFALQIALQIAASVCQNFEMLWRGS